MGENNNLLEHLFHASKSAHNTRNVWGKKEKPPTDPWYGADKIQPKRLEKRLSRVFIEEILRPPEDAHWIGFKEIRYPRLGKELPEFMQFCRRVFPNAFFVFNSRDADDVAKSKWWARKPHKKVVNIIEEMDKLFAEMAREYPNFTHHVFYEKTIADPASLQPLFDKLGENLDLELAHSILGRRLTH